MKQWPDVDIPFHKYQAAGNDYIVVDPQQLDGRLEEAHIRLLCNRHYGIGADGVLAGPLACGKCFSLHIYNADGSEAEKSGNGLRIFARFLWDRGYATRYQAVILETPAGRSMVRPVARGSGLEVMMGEVRFTAAEQPGVIEAGGQRFYFYELETGNPHCVIPVAETSAALASKYGPLLETHTRFPRHTNVQFMQMLDNSNLELEIWERGSGYTWSSGSSATAAAAVARKYYNASSSITVHMPGGYLDISLSADNQARLAGPVVHIGTGIMVREALTKS